MAITKEIPKISVLSPLVTRILGMNPSKFTLQGTDTYLVGKGSKRVLIDTGEGRPEYTTMLSNYLELLGIEIEAIMLTHWHHDHVGGVEPILRHPRMGKSLRDSVLPKVYKYRLAEDLDDVYDSEDDRMNLVALRTDNADKWTAQDLKRATTHTGRYPWRFTSVDHGQLFQFDGFTLQGFHTPGHASDHVVYWLAQENALFSGDNVLGEGTTVFDNLSEYMGSLELMGSLLKAHQGKIYPAHGNVVENGYAKIEEYIAHRSQREMEILKVMNQHHQEKGAHEPIETMTIVETIYKGYPNTLYNAAARGVNLHLEKLHNDSKVKKHEAGKWKLHEDFNIEEEAKL